MTRFVHFSWMIVPGSLKRSIMMVSELGSLLFFIVLFAFTVL